MHVVTTWPPRDAVVATTLKRHVAATWICMVAITWQPRGDVTLQSHVVATCLCNVTSTIQIHVAATWICMVEVTWQPRGNVTLQIHVVATCLCNVTSTIQIHVAATWICMVEVTWQPRGDVTLHFHISTKFSLFCNIASSGYYYWNREYYCCKAPGPTVAGEYGAARPPKNLVNFKHSTTNQIGKESAITLLPACCFAFF